MNWIKITDKLPPLERKIILLTRDGRVHDSKLRGPLKSFTGGAYASGRWITRNGQYFKFDYYPGCMHDRVTHYCEFEFPKA